MLAPEKVYAEDAAGETESGGVETDRQTPLQGINLQASVNKDDTAYNISVQPVPEPAYGEKLEYSTDGERYYDWEKIPSEGIGANTMFTLYARKAAIGNKDASLATKGAITTPRDSGVPTISGADKFSDRTEVTIRCYLDASVWHRKCSGQLGYSAERASDARNQPRCQHHSLSENISGRNCR